MIQDLSEIEDTIVESSAWENIKNFMALHINFGEGITISIFDVIVVITVIFITTLILRFILRVVTKKLPPADKGKFNVIYEYFRWLVYLIILLVTFQTVGINVTAVFAASAALLIGVGLALQTLFQDIISGIFILVDQSVQVGDVIEIDGKVGRVEEIKFRTTRAVTFENKVLVIPNHLYLENSLYNWTQNGTLIKETITVGIAYGSDVQLVKKLLLQAANAHPEILSSPPPFVIFADFGESALDFKLMFTLADSFRAQLPMSDLRFEIDRLFREHNVIIPFPQRDIHIIKNSE